jgi:hypothetical protein
MHRLATLRIRRRNNSEPYVNYSSGLEKEARYFVSFIMYSEGQTNDDLCLWSPRNHHDRQSSVRERCHSSLLSWLYAKSAQRNAQKPTLVARGWAARPHIGNVVTEKMRQYGWDVLPHAPYSPDMSPPDFNLFPKLKQPMRGRRLIFNSHNTRDPCRLHF